MSQPVLRDATFPQAPLHETRVYSFGPFRLLPAQRLLLNGEERVHLGSRALEILLTLIERAGEVVSKGELIARVWPDSCVEEGNLKVQVAALRRAFGAGSESHEFIATYKGRGYRFVALGDEEGAIS
jgi:DNA-binding winged helix-turn-helix (wHTH) protein